LILLVAYILSIVFKISDQQHAKQSKKSQLIPTVNPFLFYTINPNMVCPHCQTKGFVKTMRDEIKSGISGGKATGAFLTGGLSLLATGLSRKQKVTKCKCTKCGSEWLFNS
jgi:hypothetical protein